MDWGIMRYVLLLSLVLSTLPKAAEASRFFWLKSFGSGTLSFWQNRYLPNTGNLCRNRAGLGSKLYWQTCSMDPDNPGRFLPGTKANWERGTGPGSRVFWESAIVRPAGLTDAQMCDAPGGYKSGMRLYYEYCTGPGSKVYWEQGTGRGSRIFWLAGTERSIAPDWVGPCMDPAVNLTTLWCEAMREDVALQNVSMIDWFNSLSATINNVNPDSGRRSSCPPPGVQSETLQNLNQSVLEALFNMPRMSGFGSEGVFDDRGTPFSDVY